MTFDKKQAKSITYKFQILVEEVNGEEHEYVFDAPTPEIAVDKVYQYARMVESLYTLPEITDF